MQQSKFQVVDQRRYGSLWSMSDPKILRASQNALVAAKSRSDRDNALVFLEIEDTTMIGRLTREEFADFSERLSRCKAPEDLLRQEVNKR